MKPVMHAIAPVFFALRPVFFCLLMLVLTSGCSDKKSSDLPTHHTQVINPNYTGAMLDLRQEAALVWGSDGSLQRTRDGKHWASIETSTHANLTRMAGNPNEGVLILIGEEGTILRSTDQGLNWQKTTINSDTSANLTALIYYPEQKIWLVAGKAGTLLTSSDQGLNWQPIDLPSNLAQLDLESLFILPDGKRLLLGGSSGLMGMSDDGGKNWQLSQLELDIPLTNFYAFGDTLVATCAYGKFLTSTNRGDSWQLLETDGKAFFNDAIFDPIHSAILLITHNGKVLRSIDAGKSWQLNEVTFHGISYYLSQIYFDKAEKLLRIFGHGGTHLISHDGGLTWESQTLSPATRFENIQPLADGQTYISYGRGGLIASSFDQGLAWQNHIPQLDVYWREALATPKGSWILVGELGFILRSENQGQSWQLLEPNYTDPITPPTYRALIAEPKTGALIAAGPTGTIMRSVDDGKTWQTAHYTPFENAEAFTDLLIDTYHQHLIAVEADGRHYISSDAGASWKMSAIKTERKFWHSSILTQSQQSVALITGQAGVIARSKDGGLTWEQLESGTDADLFGSYADNKHQQFFVMGSGGSLLRSRDMGDSWQQVTTNSTDDLRRMIIDPQTNALIAFGGNGVILRSSDAGDSWQQVVSDAQQELRAAVIDPRTQALLITGRDGKIIRSIDGGITWSALASHTKTHFRGMAIDKSGNVVALGERIVYLPESQTH